MNKANKMAINGYVVRPEPYVAVDCNGKEYRVGGDGRVMYWHEFENGWFECYEWDSNYDEIKAFGLKMLSENEK